MSIASSIPLSIVIPVYNEALNLPTLFARLYPVLDALGRRYEIIFTNDGSADRSIQLLRAQYAARPDVTRVIDFNSNYGQHMAIMAAFERVRGEGVHVREDDHAHLARRVGVGGRLRGGKGAQQQRAVAPARGRLAHRHAVL